MQEALDLSFDITDDDDDDDVFNMDITSHNCGASHQEFQYVHHHSMKYIFCHLSRKVLCNPLIRRNLCSSLLYYLHTQLVSALEAIIRYHQ